MKKRTTKRQQGDTRPAETPQPAERVSLGEGSAPPANWRDAVNKKFKEEAAVAWAASEESITKVPPLDEDTKNRKAYDHFTEVEQKLAEQSQWTRSPDLKGQSKNLTEFEKAEREVWSLLDKADRLEGHIDGYEGRGKQSLDEDCKADELREQVATLRKEACAALDAWDEQRKSGKEVPAGGLLDRYLQVQASAVPEANAEAIDFHGLTVEQWQDRLLKEYKKFEGGFSKDPTTEFGWRLDAGKNGALSRVVEWRQQLPKKGKSQKTVRKYICAALDREKSSLNPQFWSKKS